MENQKALLRKIDPDMAIFSVGVVKKKTRIRATVTLDRLEKYLSKPVYRDAKGWRRWSANQIKELIQIWQIRNPDRWVD